MRAKEFTIEAFGQKEDPGYDYEITPQTKKEKLGNLLSNIGGIVGAVAGYKLTPDGFWGTSIGTMAGLFLGYIPGARLSAGDQVARANKAKQIATQLSTNQQLKSDFTIFVKSLFQDTPKSILQPKNAQLTALDVERGNIDPSDEFYEKSRKAIQPWLEHYETEWNALASKYQTTPIVLGMVFESMFGHSAMEEWLIMLKKKFNLYNAPYQNPFTGNR